MGYKTLGLERAIYKRLEEEATANKISLNSQGYDNQFKELINKLFEKFGRVVILIDEYDKPIIDYLDDLDQANTHRNILKTFYSILKDLDEKLRLVFITGVSKFSRVSKPYLGKGKAMIAIGINFSSEKKEVDEWEMRKL